MPKGLRTGEAKKVSGISILSWVGGDGEARVGLLYGFGRVTTVWDRVGMS